MTKTVILILSFILFSPATMATKVIKGGRIIISNKNLSDMSYGPARGQTMRQVVADYGNPIKKSAPVGKPPITRWYYRDFIVFFEGKYVIQSVINQDKQVITQPSQ